MYQVWLVSRLVQASQMRLVPVVSQLSQVLMVSQASLVPRVTLVSWVWLLSLLPQVSQVSLSSLTRDLEKLPSAPAAEAAPPAPREDVADREQKAAYFVLAAALLSKPYALGCKVEEFGFTGDLKEIADFIARERATGRVRPSGIFDVLGADSKELSAVLGLDYGDNLDGAQAERYFRDCVHTLRRKALNERIEGARAAFSAAETQEERAEALKRIDEYTKELRKFNIGGRR